MKRVLLSCIAYSKGTYHYVTVDRHVGAEDIGYEFIVMVCGLLFLLIFPVLFYYYVGWAGVVAIIVLNLLIINKIQKDTNRALGPRKKTTQHK